MANTMIVHMQTLQFRKKTASWRILVLAMLLSAVMLQADDTNSPSITQEPQGRSVTESEIVRLSVTASGAEPLSYQWRRKGEPLFGESRAQLVIWGARETDSGDYTVVVTNDFGSAISERANLTVFTPKILMDPPSGVATLVEGGVGESVRFSIAPLPTPLIAYQWARNGVEIPGATGSNLILAPIQLTNSGTYSACVRVENNYGYALSDKATLRVRSVELMREEWTTHSTVACNPFHFATDKQDNYYVLGSRDDGASPGFVISKFNSEGKLLWEGPTNPPNMSLSVIGGMAIDSQGNIIVVGTGTLNIVSNDRWLLILKYDPTGAFIWNAAYFKCLPSGECAGTGHGVAVDPSDNIYVTGSVGVPIPGNRFGQIQMVTLKYDPDGNLKWQDTYDGGWDRNIEGQAVGVDAHTNIWSIGTLASMIYDGEGNRLKGGLVGGTGVSFDTNGNAMIRYTSGLSKLDSTGTYLWGADLEPTAVVTPNPKDGSVILAGGSGNPWRSDGLAPSCVTLRKVSPEGSGVWRRDCGPISIDGYWVESYRSLGATIDSDGCIYVTGDAYPSPSGLGFLAKYTPNGDLVTFFLKPQKLGTASWLRNGIVAGKDASVIWFSGKNTLCKFSQRPKLHIYGRAASGQMAMSVSGRPNRPLIVESSTDLLNWIPLSTLIPSIGSADYADPDSAIDPSRFYRILEAAP